MDERGLELSQKFARLVIDTALQSQGPALAQELARELSGSVRRELESLRATAALQQQQQMHALQAVHNDVSAWGQALEDRIKLLAGELAESDRLLSAQIQHQLPNAGAAPWPMADIQQLVRQEITNAIAELDKRLRLDSENRRAAGADAEHPIRDPRSSVPEAGAAARMPKSSGQPSGQRRKVKSAAEPEAAGQVRLLAWGRSPGLVAGIAIGALATTLLLVLGKAMSTSDPSSPAPTAALPPAPGETARPGTTGVPPATQPAAPAPQPEVRSPAPPVPVLSTEDRYVHDLIEELFKATGKSQPLKAQVVQAFSDVGISTPADPGARPTVAMHHLDAIAVKKPPPALAGFMLQALLLKEGQKVARIDGEVGPATTELLSKTPCVSKGGFLKKEAAGPLDLKANWTAIIQACVR